MAFRTGTGTRNVLGRAGKGRRRKEAREDIGRWLSSKISSQALALPIGRAQLSSAQSCSPSPTAPMAAAVWKVWGEGKKREENLPRSCPFPAVTESGWVVGGGGRGRRETQRQTGQWKGGYWKQKLT